ncbi:hypothetical protein [Nostoc phage A1]|nr:hypothetical protein [Nostoc phage A1]
MFSLTINIYNGDQASAIAEINTKLDGVVNKMSELSDKISTLEQLSQAEIAEFQLVVTKITDLRSTVEAQTAEIARLNELLAAGGVVTAEDLARLDQLIANVSGIVNPEV